MHSPLPILLALLFSVASHAADRPPNVVILFADDMAYADLGVYGAKGYQTPRLDRLAGEGRMFTSFRVAQAVCTASRVALLTGCYPNRLGLHGALGPGSKVGVHAEETTLAEMLKDKGYSTGIFGKWHLGDAPEFLPTRHGFDEYLGLPYSNDMWPYHPEAKPGAYPALPLIENDRVIDPAVTPEKQATLTGLYADRAVQFIEKHREKPFFLYLPFSMPHVPIYPGKDFAGKTERGTFGDVISEIDWAAGRVLDALERLHLTENTLVIFTSDNGPWLSYGDHAGSAAPLREGKGTVFEGGVRVPCIMRFPGRIPAGTVCNEPLMTIDLLPTIAGLTGAPLPKQKIDGKDVWPVISGKPDANNLQRAYWHYYADNQLQAVSIGHWKLVLPHTYRTLNGGQGGNGGKPVKYQQGKVLEPELYNLLADAGESRNVASANPKHVEDLLAVAEHARKTLGDSLSKRQGSENRPPGRRAMQ